MTPFVIIYLICSLLVFLLCIQPLVWQLTHRNIAASAHITFVMFILLTNVVNASIWPEAISMTDWPGFIFCDIQIKIVMFAKYGIYGSTAAMLRNLAKILDTSSMALPTRKQKILDLVFTYSLCFGLPLMMPALHYLVMASRYTLYPVAGCEQSIDTSLVGMLLVSGPIIILDLFAAYYAILTLHRLHRHHKTITTILSSSPTASSTSTTTATRYYRLLSLSLLTALLLVPSSIALTIYRLNIGHFQPYSLSNILAYSFNYVTVYWGNAPTHFGAFAIDFDGGGGATTNPTWSRASYVLLGICVVLILGWGREAGKMYRRWFGVFVPALRGSDASDAFRRRRRTQSAQSWDRMTGSSVFVGWRNSVTGLAKAVWAGASKRSLSSKSRGSDASSSTSMTNCSITGDLPTSPQSLQHTHAHIVKEGDVEVSEVRRPVGNGGGMVCRHDGDVV